MLVKGPFHIRKKFCEAQPVPDGENYSCSEGAIAFVEGMNPIDLSGIPLPAGDINVNGGGQDGAVTSNDIVYIRNGLGSSDSVLLQQADVNLDGIIDTQDYSLIIETLSRGSDTDE